VDRGLTGMASSTVLSRHTSAMRHRWNLEARNASAWCRIPGSPFAPGFILFPNPPDLPAVTAEFGPFDLPGGVDTFTFFAASRQRAAHPNTLNVEIAILDGSKTTLARSNSLLQHEDEACLTLTMDAPAGTAIHLSFTVSFEDFLDRSVPGAVEILYGLGYERNPLNDLFNASGSDKGTEIHCMGGVPHCYALDYYRHFAPFREDTFNLLEIGLQNARQDDGLPSDAPSLRGWRGFFPNATVYGYDINDFGFLPLEDTFTFQGDQSSRDDLQRFLATYREPPFRLVVDDGSHVPSHQQISLAALFPSLEPGGMYVIEDLAWQPYPESPRTVDVLQGHIDGGGIDSPFLTEAEAQHLEAAIERIEIYKPNDSESALIWKRGAR
jgi:hypothetical protein